MISIAKALCHRGGLVFTGRARCKGSHQIIEWRGKPKQIRCDNGLKYISKLLESWAEKNQIQLVFIQPGNPQQNAYIERYNRTV